MMTNDFLIHSIYIGVLLTLGTYALGIRLRRLTGWGIFNPLLVATLLCIAILSLSHIPYSTYAAGAGPISYLLTPATICLAVPLYEQIEHLKHNSHAITMGVTAGVLASMITVLLLVLILGMDHRAYVTMLPKSITTAIGMGVSEELGGNTPVTIMVIIITGIVGNILSERFLRIMHIKHPIAKGIAIGAAAHVIGTSKAMEMGKTEGAMSSLAIVTSGIITVVVASVFASLA